MSFYYNLINKLMLLVDITSGIFYAYKYSGRNPLEEGCTEPASNSTNIDDDILLDMYYNSCNILNGR